jgi:hypothetical protein
MTLEPNPHLRQHAWRRCEIESYLCTRETLLDWAREAGTASGGPIFGEDWARRMAESVAAIEAAMQTLSKGSPWSPDAKVTDDFLDPLFENFYRGLGLPNALRKTDYHVLARHVRADAIDPEVSEVLKGILAVCDAAKPRGEP